MAGLRRMRFTARFAFASAFFAFVTTGCAGSIHVVEDARGGGTVALRGSEDRAREKAERHMKTKCPAGYEIVEEGDAMNQVGDREWRLTYACKGASAEVTRLAF